MVSLINFKLVNEELMQQQQQQQQRDQFDAARTNQMIINVISHQQVSENYPNENGSEKTIAENRKCQLQQISSSQQLKKMQKCSQLLNASSNKFKQSTGLPEAGQISSSESTHNFVVTWRNLKFVIEPKWHQRLVNNVNPKLRRAQNNPQLPTSHPASVGQPTVGQSNVDKVVLDRLDGLFRSGELTAILGPSGKYRDVEMISQLLHLSDTTIEFDFASSLIACSVRGTQIGWPTAM